MAFDMGMKYYLDPFTKTLKEATRSEDGWIQPRLDAETNIPFLNDDDPLIAEYLRGQYGFDPRLSSEDFRYAQGGAQTQILNDKTGDWEQGVQNALGERNPLSLAKGPVRALPGYESSSEFDFLKETGKDWFSGPGQILMMPFTAGASSAISGALGTSPAVSGAILGAGKSLLSGSNPLIGALTSYGSSFAMDALKAPAVTASVTNGANPTAVNSYNVSNDMPGFFDDLLGLEGGYDTSFLSDPNYGYDDYSNFTDVGSVPNDEWNRLLSGITGNTVDLGNSDFMSPTSGGNPLFTNGAGLVKTLAALAAAGGEHGGTASKLLKSVLGGGGSLGGNILSQVGDNPLGAAFNSLPFLLALQQASSQKNDIQPYIDRLNGLSDQFAGNQSGFIKSLTDPFDQQTARGRGDLTQSLSSRGVLGSSFGNADLENFDLLRDTGRANLVSRGTTDSIGAAGGLLNSALTATNNRNLGANALIGAGLSASGSLFKPVQDPFNLKALLGA